MGTCCRRRRSRGDHGRADRLYRAEHDGRRSCSTVLPRRCSAASTIPGALSQAGFIVGILENLAGAYVVGTELKLSVALVIIIAVLVMRPAGLFGYPVVTRV